VIRAAREGMRVEVISDDRYHVPVLCSGTVGTITKVGAIGPAFGPFVYLKLASGRIVHTYRKNLRKAAK
jgi:hypothetical protein